MIQASEAVSSPPGARSLFVGRERELALLERGLKAAEDGGGQIVMVAGEAGIGKTRLLQELAARARRTGAEVLWGGCEEGGAGEGYEPFREALDRYAAEAGEATLRSVLGPYAPVLARLVPRVRQQLADLAEPVSLPPEEERIRLFDAISQSLIGIAKQAPLVLVLDDLQWAEPDTVALLRHVGNLVPRQRMLLLGAYRTTEVDEEGPLAQTLALLQRQPCCEPLRLQGFASQEVAELLAALMDAEPQAIQPPWIDPALLETLRAQTAGNPFFVRALGWQLIEDRTLTCVDGRWQLTRSLDEMVLPESARQLLSRRVRRLSEAAQRFLTVAAAVGQTFRFDVVAAVAELSEEHALCVVDEPLGAQLIEAAKAPDAYTFVHALVRQTLYELLNPSRRVRLHRRIAEGMEHVYQERADEHAAEIARHYHLSASLPGAERGVAPALTAADVAATVYAYDETATFLRIALELLPQSDGRRARLLGRLGMALSGALAFEEALRVMGEAGDLIARTESDGAAADYLAEAAMAMWMAGCQRGAWTLASQGLRYVGERRDLTWVRLMSNDILRREAEDVDNSGNVIDSPDRRAVASVAASLPLNWTEKGHLSVRGFIAPRSRTEILERFADDPNRLMGGAGEYRRSLRLWEEMAVQSEREGRIFSAAAFWASSARCHNALGALPAARKAYAHAAALVQRLSDRSHSTLPLALSRIEMQVVVDEGWGEFIGEISGQHQPIPENNWVAEAMRAQVAWLCARLGNVEQSLLMLQTLVEPLERGPGWAIPYDLIVFNAAATLWLLQRTDHIEVIERNLREKILAPDFRHPMEDARLSLAHLSALQGRYDEAVEWFARARTVLDEQGARPLRAIVDFDEALMYQRRGAGGDAERIRPLLDAALLQFRAIGMPGWIRRAEELLPTVAERSPAATLGPAPGDTRHTGKAATAETLAERPAPAAPNLFRKSGEYWTIAYAGVSFQLKDTKGLSCIAHLLRHPGEEFHALDLVRLGATDTEAAQARFTRTSRDAGPILDADARRAYKRRLIELRQELDEAQACNDPGRAARAQHELDALTHELAGAVGLSGRERRVGSQAERARVNITRNITLMLQKIATHHPELGRHFARTLKTGTFCSYAIDPRARVEWTL